MSSEGANEAERTFIEQLPLIERVIAFICARHHVSRADAEDFASHVKLKFVEDEYAILTKFKHRSSLQTYLTTVVHRLFVDYQVALWGRWRPSAAARRHGATGIELERLLVREGLGFEQACEALRSHLGVTASREDLETIAKRLPVRFRRTSVSDDELDSLPSLDRSPDDAVADEHTARELESALAGVLARMAAPDRLLMALRFEDGLTVADIAKTLGGDQKALYRRVERLLRHVRTELESCGIDSRTAFRAVESAGIEIDWGPLGNG